MTSSSPHSIGLARCGSYEPQQLDQALAAVIATVKLPSSLHGHTVLLKPNLISSRGPALACTNPFFLAAVARCFHELGARIRIGDSPAFGTTASVMSRHDMLAPLAGLPVEQVLFARPVPRQLAGGLRVELSAEALECDLLVNLPKLKAHNQTYLTCAVKNFFGVVVGMRKAMLHMTLGGSPLGFADMLLSLPDLVGPHVTLVDAVEVMHRSGPLDGERLSLGCLAAGNCPVAVDTALLELLELSHDQSPLWQAAHLQGHPGALLTNIRYPLAVPADFHGSGFVAPAGLNPIRFNPFRLLYSGMRRFALAIRS